MRYFRDKTAKSNLGALTWVKTDRVVVHPRWIPGPFGHVEQVWGHRYDSITVVYNFWCPNVPIAALKMVYTSAKSKVAVE